MRKNLLLSFLVSLSVLFQIHAQERTVTGKVTASEDGSGLPGVSIQIKGTSKGVQTSATGAYSVQVPDNATLVFSYIGLLTQEVAVGNRSVVDVALANDSKQLSEVVVTAQGIVREKKALGYAVTSVGNELIQNRPEADISRVLQGKAPGVNITSTGGISGSGTNITIRGYKSATGSNQPLFVVDGVPFNTNTNTANAAANSTSSFTSAGGQSSSSRMLDIDPNNIENISVLKGLSATVLYGDQGRNGVILITTKTGGGKRKNAEISLNQSYYQNTIASLPIYQDNYGGGFQQLTPTNWFFSNWGANFADQPKVYHPIGISGVAGIRNAFPQYALDPTKPWGNNAAGLPNVVQIPNVAQPNVGESFFRKGNVHQTSLQLSGSSDRSGYNASVGYQNEQGFTPGNDLKKINLGLGVNSSLTDKVSIRSSFTYANTDYKTPPLNAGTGSNSLNGVPSIFANVLYTPRNVNLAAWPYENPVDRSSVYYRGGNDIVNPIWASKYYSNTSKVNRFFTSTSLNYDFNNDFSMTYRLGFDTYSENQEVRLNKGGQATDVNIGGGMYRTVAITNSIWNHDVMLNYKHQLSEKLHLTALLGANNRFDTFDQFGLTSTGQLAFNLFKHQNFTSTASIDPVTNRNLNSESKERRIGVYSNVILDFSDYLFLNLSARNDWTSTVEEANRRILYPGASLSFIPTSAFDMSSKTLNDLKFRVSYGTSAGFPPPYSTRNILAQSGRGFVNAGGTVFPTQGVSNTLGNPNLKPELHKEIELGIESTMFSNRLRYDFSIYEKNTKDLITNAPIDPATGYQSTFINIGRIRTRGVEFSATVSPFKSSKGFNWDITANYGKYKSMTMELGNNLEEIVIAGFSNQGNFAIPGKPFNFMKGQTIARNANGEKIVLPNGQYKLSTELGELGDPNPAFTSSLINSFSYKGFTLSAMMEYRHRGMIMSNTVKGVLARGLSKDTDQLDRDLTLILPGVQEDGSKNTVQVTAANYFFDNYFNTDEAITFDGSTIRLREASFAYALPAKIIAKSPFKRVSLALTGSNLWFRALNFPKYVNFDTDVLSLGVGNGLGFDYLTGPSARRLGGTLSLTF
jgi:TonB-linked SusC/RagA family outer membrane protein